MTSPALRFAILLFYLAHGSILRAQAPATSTPAPAALPRTWTTSDGRAFQATLVNVQGTQIVLKMPTGQLATVPLMRLSLGDQVFVKGSMQPAATTPGGATTVSASSVLPPEKRTWPAKVEVDSRAIEVKMISESAADRKYVYQSQAFDFTSEDKLAGSVMKEIARTFEATRSLVEALPWGIEPKPPADLGRYQAKFYVSHESYVAAGAPKNSGGVYMSSDRVFRVPFPSLGLEMRGKTWFKNENYHSDTIVHEITHQMMHEFLPFMPIWAIEGTAEYTEMLPYNAGRFLTSSHERGLKEYLKKAQERGLNPADVGQVMDHLSMTSAAWHQRADEGGKEQHRLYYASCLLVYYFSHLDGDGKGTRFFKYLDKMREARLAWDTFFKNPRVKLEADGRFTYPSDLPLPSQQRKDAYGLEQLPLLLDGRDAAKLQKDVVDGFKKIGVRW